MDLQTEITVEPDHLVVVGRGPFTLEGLRRFIDAIGEAAREYGRRAVLVDVTGVSGKPSTMDRFEVGEMVALRLNGLRVAAHGTTPFIEPGAFAAVVANNRGAALGVFLDETEARQWLEVGPGGRQENAHEP